MKRKILISVAIILTAALLVTVLVACNKSYKQDALPDSPGAEAAVTSNGGMAVKVGNYLYFINGYAGQDGDNEFKNVVKGAIMRAPIENGVPNRDKVQTVVPKNVYNSEESSSLVIKNGYIYFTTPNDENDSNGDPKTSEMILMRSTLDGSKIETIAKFNDYTVTYRVSANYIVYQKGTELRLIDLNDKFEDSLVASEVGTVVFPDYADNSNALDNVVFYTKTPADPYASHNEIWAYRAGSAPVKAIDGLGNYDIAVLPHPAGYSITILDVDFVGTDKVRLHYTKTDSGANKRSTGVYSYTFDASFAFNSANEIRYTKGVTYTALKFVDDMHILATDSDSIDMIYFENNEWKRMPVVEAAATVMDVVKTDNSYALTYLQSNVVKKLNFTFDGTLTLETNTTLFNNAYSSDWLGLDLVDGIVYFFNDDVLDNIYYLDLKKVDSRDVRTQTATRLGVFSDTDIIAMLESDTASTDE